MKKTIATILSRSLLFQNSDEKTLAQRARRLVPILGTSENFLAALHRYQLGKLRLEEDEVREARADGLVALLDAVIEAGLIVSVFGRGLFWSTSLVKSALLTTYVGRVGREFSAEEFDILLPLSKRLLKNSSAARTFMDTVFELTRQTLVSTIR